MIRCEESKLDLVEKYMNIVFTQELNDVYSPNKTSNSFFSHLMKLASPICVIQNNKEKKHRDEANLIVKAAKKKTTTEKKPDLGRFCVILAAFEQYHNLQMNKTN